MPLLNTVTWTIIIIGDTIQWGTIRCLTTCYLVPQRHKIAPVGALLVYHSVIFREKWWLNRYFFDLRLPPATTLTCLAHTRPDSESKTRSFNLQDCLLEIKDILTYNNVTCIVTLWNIYSKRKKHSILSNQAQINCCTSNNRDVMLWRFYFRLAVQISIVLAKACFKSYITRADPRLSSVL